MLQVPLAFSSLINVLNYEHMESQIVIVPGEKGGPPVPTYLKTPVLLHFCMYLFTSQEGRFIKRSMNVHICLSALIQQIFGCLTHISQHLGQAFTGCTRCL